MKDNILAGLGFKVKNYSELDKLATGMTQAFKKYDVMFTAHSKGNVPASIVSGLTKFKAATFNPAGVSMKLAGKFDLLDKHSFDAVKYIIKQGDLLNDLQNKSTILKYLMPSAKGTGYIINNASTLNQSTFTLSAYIGKLLKDGLTNHKIIKMLNK
jgi:hypothetical protein